MREFQEYQAKMLVRFDADRDGRLSDGEIKIFREAVLSGTFPSPVKPPIPQGQLPPPLQPFDKDGDGKLSDGEILELQIATLTGRLQPLNAGPPDAAPGVPQMPADGQPPPAAIREFQEYQARVFTRFDTERDGQLSEAEVKLLRAAIEDGTFQKPPLPPIRPGPLPPELKKYDRNNNGSLDAGELLSLQIDALTGKFRPPGASPPPGGPGAPDGDGGPRMLPGHSAPAQLSPERRAIMRREKVIEAMRLRKGATVVDIGAGHGLFTFPLAQAVGDSGRVFATDVDPEVVKSLNSHASQLGHGNVKGVRVSPLGVDPFYTRERFDVIFMCDSIQLIQDPASFFRELRGSLKPGGRLWVLALRLDADFSAEEFSDLQAVRSTLAEGRLAALIGGRLPPETKSAIASASAADVGEAFRLLSRDLSRMLNDGWLHREIVDAIGPDSPLLNPKEKGLRDFLSSQFVNWQPAGDVATPGRLRLLNRLVLQDVFKTGVWEKALSLNQYVLDDWKFLIRGMEFDTQIVPLLRDARFELVAEHRILDANRIWEFRIEGDRQPGP